MDPQLIDQIYESAFVPELWPAVLGELARIANARTGWLHISSADTHRASSSNEPRFHDIRPLIEGGWVARSARVSRFFAARHAGFFREIDIFRGDDLEDHFKNDPTCRDILIPRGLGRVAATMLELPTADRAFISLDREWVKGAVEDEAVRELDVLRPHLARSALMSARLELREARVAGATLARLGLPALVLDDKGKVLSANELMETLSGLICWRAHDRIVVEDRAADKLFHDAIESVSLPAASVRSFPVRGTNGGANMVAHVIPVRLAARDIFVRCAAALILTPVCAPNAPPVELVQSLFDLTPAEARVARSLASGKSVEDMAQDGGVSANTIRTQLRGVLEKTGCGRQAEVVGLLGGISPVRINAH